MSRDRLPPPAPPYLTRRYPSTQKGGTLIAEDVTDLEAHRRRLCDTDGYRPSSCRRCGHPRLHVHDYPERQFCSEKIRCLIKVVRHRCVGCGAVWRILPAFLACFLRCIWSLIERTLQIHVAPPPPSLLPSPPPSLPPASLPSALPSPLLPPPSLSSLSPPVAPSPASPAPALRPPQPSSPPLLSVPSEPLSSAPAASQLSPSPPSSSTLADPSLPPASLSSSPALSPLSPAPSAPSRRPASSAPPSSAIAPSASTVRRWRARLAMSAALLCQVLAQSGTPALEHLAKMVGLVGTRAELVAVYVTHHSPPKGQSLSELAALAHRLAPGVRLM